MTDKKARVRKIFLGMGVLILIMAIALDIGWHLNRHAVTEPLPFREQRIVAGCTDNFPPFDLRDQSGDHIGYARDISMAVAKELDVDIEYRTSSRWVEVVEWLKNGKVDLIPLIAYSRERDEYFDFTIPHTLVPEVIFVRSERLDIHGLDDLEGKQIGAVRRHITHEKLLQHEGLNIMVFETPREGVEALLDGKVDAFAYPQFVFAYLMQEMGREDEIKIVGEPLGHLRYGMAVREGDQVLLSYLDRAIKRIETSGKRNAIAQHWFGRKVFLGLTREEVLSLLGWAVFGLLVASLGSSLYISIRYKLRKAEAVLRHNLIFQHMDDSVILINLNGKITDWNPGAERMFGYSREEILGRRLDFLLASEGSTKLFETIIRGVQGNGIWSGEIHAVRKYGSQVVCSVRMTALRNEKGHIIAYTSIIRDITELKRAEEALRLSEERFSKAFRSSPDMFVISRLTDGRILEVNDAWESLFGYSREEMLGKSSLSLNLYVNPLDRQRAILLLQKQGFVRDFELDIKRKSGDVRQVSLSAEEIEINGEPCILSIIHDITERKRAEQIVKTMLDNVVIGIAMISPKMEIIWLNKTFKEWFPNIDIQKKPLCYQSFYSPPKEKICDYCPTIKAFKTSKIHSSETGVCAHGRIYNVIATPVKDEKSEISYVVETVEDITERKRAEEELQEHRDENTKLAVIAKERSELQEWINTFDTFVGKFDPNGVIIFCNEAPIKAAGLTKGDVYGKYFPDTKWWSHSEIERARIVECLERAKAGLSSRIETNFRSADGTPVAIIFNCQPVMDDDGKVKYITAEGKIIIEEVKLRNALQEEKESLEKRVKERTSELVAVNEKLKKEIAKRKRAEEELKRS